MFSHYSSFTNSYSGMPLRSVFHCDRSLRRCGSARLIVQKTNAGLITAQQKACEAALKGGSDAQDHAMLLHTPMAAPIRVMESAGLPPLSGWSCEPGPLNTLTSPPPSLRIETAISHSELSGNATYMAQLPVPDNGIQAGEHVHTCIALQLINIFIRDTACNGGNANKYTISPVICTFQIWQQ